MHKKQRLYWQGLHFATNKPNGRSARVVSKEIGDGEVAEFEGQSAVEQAIWDGIHNRIFYLAEQVPIYKGSMYDAFGYLAITITT